MQHMAAAERACATTHFADAAALRPKEVVLRYKWNSIIHRSQSWLLEETSEAMFHIHGKIVTKLATNLQQTAPSCVAVISDVLDLLRFIQPEPLPRRTTEVPAQLEINQPIVEQKEGLQDFMEWFLQIVNTSKFDKVCTSALTL